MEERVRYQRLYKIAYKYLLDILPEGKDQTILDKYFKGDNKGFSSLENIYEQFIHSAQNYQSMPNIIRYDERKKEIKHILYDFNLNLIKVADVDDLYYKFRKEFKVTSKDTKRNSWRKWSKSAIDSAIFLSQFHDTEDFKSFINLFDNNTSTRMALPLLISTKISGIGFALACDCLKELGYLNYPKPDIHLIDVFNELGFSSRQPIDVFETVVKMSEACLEKDANVTPYKVDKIIWLICSGKFYLDNENVGRHKEEFIRLAKMNLTY